ncbi:MAG: FHA domain-containing protein [Bacteriovoracaceae bacterium]|nr:FHA domain-containing protein [Bacteriovoracaceae bacterium]
MGFKSLFGKSDSPRIVGDDSGNEESGELVRRFCLEFQDLEGEPTFELESSLSIGSEDGDVTLDYEGISPKHCTIILNQDILSIIDHGSSEGTYVNKKKIPAGKMIILDPKDKLKLGSIPFKIVQREVPISTPEALEDNRPVSEELESEISEEPITIPTPEADMEAPADEVPPAPLAMESEDRTQDVVVPTQELGLELSQSEMEVAQDSESNDKEEVQVEQLIAEKNPEQDIEDEDLSSSEQPDKEKGPSFLSKLFKKKKKTKLTKISINSPSVDAANGFLRVMGFVFDTLIVGTIYSILSSFPSFTEVVQTLPSWIGSMLEPLFTQFILPQVETIYALVPAIEQMVETASSLYKDEYFFYVEIAVLLAVWRFVTAIVFGQTLGEFLAGIRAQGSFLKKRVLSIIRAFFGALLLPLFWLFDFPTLFSKRGLKEVLSGTRLHTPSSLIAIISLLIFTPLLVCLFFMSPLLKGLSLPTPIEFKGIITVKLANYEKGERPVESSYYKLTIPMEKLHYVLPGFKFSQKNGKSKLEPSITIVDQNTKAARVSLLKEVNLGSLLEEFVRSNPFASINYPGISQMVNDVSNTNKSFKSRTFPQELIGEEIQRLMMVSLSIGNLEVEQIEKNLKESGPFLGPYLDFKDKLLALFDSTPTNFEFRQVGSAFHIVANYQAGAMERIKLLPLNSKRTRLYQVSFLRNDKVDIFELFAFNSGSGSISTNAFLGFIDLLSSNELKKNVELVTEVFQSVYGRYYELSKKSLELGDEDLYRRIKVSTNGVLQILTENTQALGLPEPISNKLSQNLTDLVKALDEKDLSFFGVNAVGVI